MTAKYHLVLISLLEEVEFFLRRNGVGAESKPRQEREGRREREREM